jgi:predicted RNase H-like HicB family nuclease
MRTSMKEAADRYTRDLIDENEKLRAFTAVARRNMAQLQQDLD